MLYIFICDETSKVKGKAKVRSRGIMLGRSPPSWPNGHTGPRSMRPDRGRPTHLWLVGPVAALYNQCGGRGTQYEVHRVAQHPTDTPYRSRVSASHGKLHHRRHPHSPTHTTAATTPPWPAARARRPPEVIMPFPSPSLCLSLQFTWHKGKP